MATQEKKEYDIGLIGCGGIAGTWVKAVEQHEQCRIKTAYDPVRRAAEQRAREAGAQVADALEDLLGDHQIDLVIVAAPTFAHPDLVIQAAQSGKHVLCEKPMALNLRLCQEMIDACEDSGVKLAVGHSLRFWGAFRTCRRLIAEGAIGAPVAGSVDRMWPADPLRAGERQGKGDWRARVRNYGGTALEGFVHELDFTRAVFGEVASVQCEISGGKDYDGLISPRLLEALVGFESGALVTARTGNTVALPTLGYWIAGTKGGLRFSNWGGPVELFRSGASEPERVPCEETSAYFLELCDLLDAIEKDEEPENSPLNGKKNVALGLGMYWSFETGQRVQYKEGIPLGMDEEYQNVRFF